MSLEIRPWSPSTIRTGHFLATFLQSVALWWTQTHSLNRYCCVPTILLGPEMRSWQACVLHWWEQPENRNHAFYVKRLTPSLPSIFWCMLWIIIIIFYYWFCLLSDGSSCLCSLSVEVIGMNHHIWLCITFWNIYGSKLTKRRPEPRELDSLNKIETNLIKWIHWNIIISFQSGSLNFRTIKLCV